MAKSGAITITQNSQSINNNTSNITVRGTITTTGESYRGNSNTCYVTVTQGGTLIYSNNFTHGAPANSTTTLFEFALTVKHNSDGTSGTISVSYNYDGGWCTASTSKTLTTIPRKSTLTVANGTMSELLEMTVNRKVDSFTHTITYKMGSQSGTICEKSSDTSVQWTPPIELASEIPKSPSGVCTITIETFNGTTSLGSNPYNINLYVPETLVPIIDDFYYTESPGFGVGGYVQGKSGLYATITARGVYGSNVTEYETTVGETAYYGSVVQTEVFTTPGEVTVSCRVKDSRGNYSEPTTITIQVIEYYTPKITKFTATRCDATVYPQDVLVFDKYNPQGAYFSVECETDFAYLNGQLAHYTLDYKKTTETEYQRESQYNVSVRSLRFVIPADVYSTYDLKLTLTDELEYTEKETVGYSARKLFDIWKTKFSIAFGKIAELENAFEVLFENIKLTGRTKVSIEGQDIDLVPSGDLLYKGENFFGGRQLWNGQSLMNETHSITFDKPISQMKNGILLVFGRNGTYNLTPYFVPKETVSAYGKTTYSFPLCTELFDYVGAKSLYISDTKIEGHTNNDATAKNGTSGITYHNEAFYLLKVYEV